MEILSHNLSINSSAAESVDGNEDLLTEILRRLPVKSLLRFKSVSKRWLSLITDPHFSRRHALRLRRSSLSGVFLRRTSVLMTKTEFDFVSVSTDDGKVSAPYGSLNFADDIKILQSCNGLFLCSTSHKIGTTRKYYIFNPSTRHLRELPPPDCGGSETVFGLNLAFEPLKSPHYEVVLVRSTAASVLLYQIDTYSSENRAWRTCGDPFAAPFDIAFDNGVFWNGAIHWLSPTGASLYFNISKMSVGEIPTIPGNSRKRSFRYFGESSGHLHLIEVHGPEATKLDVFELERDYSRWVVKYQINIVEVVATAFPEMLREHLGPGDSIYHSFIVFYVARDEEDDGKCSLLLHIPGKVVSCNVEDMVCEKVCDIETLQSKTETKMQFGWFDAHPFLESMACV